MELHPCIPCQYGAHDEHIEWPERAAEGVMGGWRCPCKGECRDRASHLAIEEDDGER
jgi:hypothetical protein